jgi:N-acetyl-gamma-glutamyl-phosphate reductase
MAPTLLAKGCKVLDLSADYRFTDLSTYTSWYGGDRTDQAIAETAVYGLPELYRDRIAEAQLVGCPGCYPTASLLGLSPLLKARFSDS